MSGEECPHNDFDENQDGDMRCTACGLEVEGQPEPAGKGLAAGRSWPALRESKVFDAERLSEMPLFDRRLF